MKDTNTNTTTLTQNASILAAVGAKGTDPKLTLIDPAEMSVQIGGTLKAIRLDKETAVFFDIGKQTAILLDPQNLVGNLALCGVDSNDTPVSLVTKQVTKYAKLFKASRTVKKDANVLSDADGKGVK